MKTGEVLEFIDKRLRYKPNFVATTSVDPDMQFGQDIDETPVKVEWVMFVPNATHVRHSEKYPDCGPVCDVVQVRATQMVYPDERLTEEILTHEVRAHLWMMEEHELKEWLCVDAQQADPAHGIRGPQRNAYWDAEAEGHGEPAISADRLVPRERNAGRHVALGGTEGRKMRSSLRDARGPEAERE